MTDTFDDYLKDRLVKRASVTDTLIPLLVGLGGAGIGGGLGSLSPYIFGADPSKKWYRHIPVGAGALAGGLSGVSLGVLIGILRNMDK